MQFSDFLDWLLRHLQEHFWLEPLPTADAVIANREIQKERHTKQTGLSWWILHI